MRKEKGSYSHSMRVAPYYVKVLEKVKLLLKTRRYKGREVSTNKAVEFLLDIFAGNEQWVKERYFANGSIVIQDGEEVFVFGTDEEYIAWVKEHGGPN